MCVVCEGMNAPLSFDVYTKPEFFDFHAIGESPSLVACEEPGPRYGREREGAPETVGDWRLVHARVVELGAVRAGHEREICRWLLAAERLGVHTRAGHASLREYAERIVGLNGRQTEERLRVGRALAGLPVLDEALATGELSWSVVRELSRVATADTEEAWRAWAKWRRSREIEQAVAARHRGDGPDDRGDPSLVKHKLSFEVRAETMALFRDAQAAVRAELGGHVDDDTLLYEIARRALGGSGEDGRASYQVAVTRCGDCGRTSIDAGGESHLVDDVVAEMAACDAQRIGCVTGPHPSSHAEATTHPEAPPPKGESRARNARSAAATASPHTGAPPPEASTQARNARRLPAGASPHMGAPSSKRARATQTIPPAVRREVLRRDRRRCVVPGCRNHVFLDVHHLDPRAEGGGHHPDRLATLCGGHHRSVHLGHLCIEGTGSEAFIVRHGDGTPYGQTPSPARLHLTSLALDALQHMGFKATEARKLVDGVVAMDVVPGDPADFVRAALRATSRCRSTLAGG